MSFETDSEVKRKSFAIAGSCKNDRKKLCRSRKEILRRFSEFYKPPRKLSVNSAVACCQNLNSWPMCDILRSLFDFCRIPLFLPILEQRHACHSIPFLSIFRSLLHLIGAVLGRIVYLLSGSYRRRLQENLERAGFTAFKDAVKEAGKNILELPFIWCAKPDRVLRTARSKNWDLVQQALDAKKGVIF
jgi:hypothetical protein